MSLADRDTRFVMSRRTLNLVQWQLLPKATKAVRVLTPCDRRTIEQNSKAVGRIVRHGKRDIVIRRQDLGNSEIVTAATVCMAMALQDKLAEAKERIWHDEMSYLRVADSLR